MSDNREVHMQAGGWAVIMGFVGGGIGGLLSALIGINFLLGVLLGVIVGGGGVYFLTVNAANAAGGLAERIYNPEGDTTPPKREYSQAESLVMRRQYAEAIEAYELHVLQYPDDPAPSLRLARLYRDTLKNYAESRNWFERARRVEGISPSQQLMILQELIDLYTRRMREPRRAMSELARLVETFPDAPGVPRAREELAAMRALVAREQKGEGTFEDLYYAEDREPT